jgi:hypothetical protein
MKHGLQFRERMSGTFTPTGGAPARFAFTVEARADSALDYLRRGRAALTGTLEAAGLADGVPITGAIEMQPLTRRRVGYDFTFTGDDGKPYRFVGEKQIRWRDPVRTFTRLPGVIQDAAGGEVATCALGFDLGADLLPFLTSFRRA